MLMTFKSGGQGDQGVVQTAKKAAKLSSRRYLGMFPAVFCSFSREAGPSASMTVALKTGILTKTINSNKPTKLFLHLKMNSMNTAL